jgi:dephospho-CoA kinase
MGFKVGLTGGVACGKTTVSDRFAQLGVEIIDADVIARELLIQGSDCYTDVVGLFGQEVLLESAEINRSWLRDRIFSDAEAKRALESIIHPAVRLAIAEASENCASDYCIVSVPLLIEANMQTLVDRILVVDLPVEHQLDRLMQRDKISLKQAQAMLAGQCSRARRLSFADDIIDNSHPVSALDEQIGILHEDYLRMSKDYG